MHNVTCHYCIVGCGYHAMSWPVDRQGGMRPDQNPSASDLTNSSADGTAWFAHRCTTSSSRTGATCTRGHARPECVVNSGLGSTRGAKIAELSYSTVTGTQGERLTEPLVWRYGVLSPTTWDDAVASWPK